LQAVVFSHLPFEDLGNLRPELEGRGFAIETIEVPSPDFPLPRAQACDLLFILGGSIAVYEAADYPFLSVEIECIRRRVELQRPTLGICLGAQLMASALNARVYPGLSGAEIGWAPIQPAGLPPTPGWFAPLFAPGLSVLHWHGDTFDLPEGAQLLASTPRYQNQAFSVGKFGLALQFHPEVTEPGLERWYVGHTCELRQKGISVPQLRADTRKHAPALSRAATHFWNSWLDYIL